MNIRKKPARLKVTLDACSINNTPAFPLALNVKMPHDHELEHANLTFRFHDFICVCLGDIQVSQEDSSDKNYPKRVKINLDEVQISGKYAIEAVATPEVDLDLGGTMMPKSLFRKPRPAGADEGTGYFDDTQQQEFLDQADEQRTRLMDTPNGQQLMSVYDQHQEVYTEMFQNSNAVRSTWQQGNVTAQMASHTSDAIKNDTTVNPLPSDQMFGEGFYQMGYNNNALVQQTTLATACMAAAKSAESLPADADAPDNKYSQAAIAASNFQKTVEATGNTQSNTTPMTPSQVNTTVDNHSVAAPQTSLAEVNNMQAQARTASPEADVAVDEAKKQGWRVLSDEEKGHMRTIMHRCYVEFCEYDDRPSLSLWQGASSAKLHNIEISVLISRSGADSVVERVDLPVFEFELDDADWYGAAADIARERLSKIHFVRSLLHEHIRKAVEQAVKQAFSDDSDD